MASGRTAELLMTPPSLSRQADPAEQRVHIMNDTVDGFAGVVHTRVILRATNSCIAECNETRS
jgi:hypothetical protein